MEVLHVGYGYLIGYCPEIPRVIDVLLYPSYVAAALAASSSSFNRYYSIDVYAYHSFHHAASIKQTYSYGRGKHSPSSSTPSTIFKTKKYILYYLPSHNSAPARENLSHSNDSRDHC